jgi:hypothetical protein
VCAIVSWHRSWATNVQMVRFRFPFTVNKGAKIKWHQLHDVTCRVSNGPPKIPEFYVNSLFRHRVHKIPPADHILSQINPILTLIPNVIMTHFSNIPQCTVPETKSSFLYILRVKLSVHHTYLTFLT